MKSLATESIQQLSTDGEVWGSWKIVELIAMRRFYRLKPFCGTPAYSHHFWPVVRAHEQAAGEKQILCLQRVIGFVQDAGN